VSHNALEVALVARLRAATGLTTLLAGTTSIFNRTAPQGAALPYVVFRPQADATETSDPHRREDVTYAVKAIAGSQSAANAISAQVDLALDGKPLTVAGSTNFWLRRSGGIAYEEAGPAGFIYHDGGLYRIRLTY